MPTRQAQSPLPRGESRLIISGRSPGSWVSKGLPLQRRPPPSSTHGWVAFMKNDFPLTVAGPRRCFTGFPVMPWGAPEWDSSASGVSPGQNSCQDRKHASPTVEM